MTPPTPDADAACPRLIFADSERCANMRYAVPVPVPDPFLWFQNDDRQYVVARCLEIARLRKALPPGIRVMSWTECAEWAGVSNEDKQLKTPALVAAVSQRLGVKRWLVPAEFPLLLAERVRAEGLELEPAETFFPGRAIKTDHQKECVRHGVRIAEAGLQRAVDILKESEAASDRTLRWHDAVLTSEILRGEIDAEIARRGGTASHTIVAPGVQGADPHNAGAGPICRDQPVVIDIFPSDDRTGYHGDLTRTVVKGTAADIVRQAFAAVDQARQRAIDLIRAGAECRAVHNAAATTLADAGFETNAKADTPYGFFHGTGHGLGLEVHEPPGLGDRDGTLEAGHVVTVEPGLYYPEWGGMRIEDVVAVTETGCERLTRFDIFLELP